MNGCLFCQIVEGKVPCIKIFENRDFLAFLDINPANKGHTLVIPKRHYETIYDMDAKDTAVLFTVVNKIAKALKRTLEMEGLNILQNNGELAGQRLPHVHVHLIPRHKEDKVVIQRYKPKEVEKKELSKLAKKISSNLGVKKEKPKKTKVPKKKKSEIERKRVHYKEWL